MRRMRRKGIGTILSTSLALLSVLVLTGCGNSAPGRLGGGTAGGAATGATFGLIGGPIGVVIGGAIGGGIGALTASNTTPKQLNLGPPPWSGKGPTPAAQAQPAETGQDAYGQQPQQLQPPAYESQPYQAPSQPVQSQPLPPPKT